MKGKRRSLGSSKEERGRGAKRREWASSTKVSAPERQRVGQQHETTEGHPGSNQEKQGGERGHVSAWMNTLQCLIFLYCVT